MDPRTRRLIPSTTSGRISFRVDDQPDGSPEGDEATAATEPTDEEVRMGISPTMNHLVGIIDCGNSKVSCGIAHRLD